MELVDLATRRARAADEAQRDNIETVCALLDRWRGRAEAGEVLRLSIAVTLSDETLDIDHSHPGEGGYTQMAAAQLLLADLTDDVRAQMRRDGAGRDEGA